MIETVWPEKTSIEARCEWARMHGIDPYGVPLHKPIYLDYGRRRIMYSRYVRDAAGDVKWSGGEDGPSPLTERVTVQLESPPRPFPEVEG